MGQEGEGERWGGDGKSGVVWDHKEGNFGRSSIKAKRRRYGIDASGIDAFVSAYKKMTLISAYRKMPFRVAR
ncbi:MAG: hypothetical protein J6W45_08315 [Bacteroidales bacterium]|nr:hypothetical protein [Bacteroidales bacterium]